MIYKYLKEGASPLPQGRYCQYGFNVLLWQSRTFEPRLHPNTCVVKTRETGGFGLQYYSPQKYTICLEEAKRLIKKASMIFWVVSSHASFSRIRNSSCVYVHFRRSICRSLEGGEGSVPFCGDSGLLCQEMDVRPCWARSLCPHGLLPCALLLDA